MRRLALVLAVVLVVFTCTFVVAGPDNEAPYSSHVDPVGEGGSYVPKADGTDNYPNYEKSCLNIEKIIVAYDPLGEGGSLVPKLEDTGPGEGGSYVPKLATPNNSGSYNPVEVAMAETYNSTTTNDSSGGGGITGSIGG